MASSSRSSTSSLEPMLVHQPLALRDAATARLRRDSDSDTGAAGLAELRFANDEGDGAPRDRSLSTAGQSLYLLLGVTKSNTGAEIKAAYRRLALLHHPDKNGNSAESIRKFQALKFAHEILGNTHKRAVYDRFGSEGLRTLEGMEQRSDADESFKPGPVAKGLFFICGILTLGYGLGCCCCCCFCHCCCGNESCTACLSRCLGEEYMSYFNAIKQEAEIAEMMDADLSPEASASASTSGSTSNTGPVEV